MRRSTENIFREKNRKVKENGRFPLILESIIEKKFDDTQQ